MPAVDRVGPSRRSLSPFSKRTVSEWVEERINDGILDGLRAAIIVDPANMRLVAHFGRRLADYALEKELILRKPAEPAQKLFFKRAALCSWLQRTPASMNSYQSSINSGLMLP